jgi:hypothetical protein
MKRQLVLVSAFVVLLAFGISQAREPFVHTIEEEEGSLETVTVDITSAEQAYIFAQGYEEWEILGRIIYIEGVAKNRSEKALNITLSFSARDIFGGVLDACERDMRLLPEAEFPFNCVLQVKDLRKFNRVTYRVSGR